MKILVESLRDMGIAGLLATLAFVGALVWASLIHFRSLGFRHRMAFFPIALMPIVIGIGKCSLQYAWEAWWHRLPQEEKDFGIFWEKPLEILVMTSMQTIILLVLGAMLLLHRNAVAKDGPYIS